MVIFRLALTTEGAHHWMGVFDELRQRGVEDVLFVSMDGVSGLADVSATVKTTILTIAH